ncbi:hypothetical protein [Streptococcus oricebi]|uniref:Uncharacterized protein n=1 Tax=Streptococcus oricebi TaxID=1547447 RepID=A0ABS5B1R9_9STRE|nr:hypothetical protein [Streptococcus oricebi]MBP2622451.1 hypothetical protein [Streptococcus oricebi]
MRPLKKIWENKWEYLSVGIVSFIPVMAVSMILLRISISILELVTPKIHGPWLLLLVLLLYFYLMYLIYNSKAKVTKMVKHYFLEVRPAFFVSTFFDCIFTLVIYYTDISLRGKELDKSLLEFIIAPIFLGIAALRSWIISNSFGNIKQKKEKEYYITAFYITFMWSISAIVATLTILTNFTPINLFALLFANNFIIVFPYFFYRQKPESIKSFYPALILAPLLFLIAFLDNKAIEIFAWFLPILTPIVLGDIGITRSQSLKATTKFKQHIYNTTLLSFVTLLVFNLTLISKPYFIPYLQIVLVTDKTVQKIIIVIFSVIIGTIFSALLKRRLQKYYFNPKNGYFLPKVEKTRKFSAHRRRKG